MVINRVDYKAIKHMDREKMSEYLQSIYKRGYEAGLKAGLAKLRIAAEADRQEAPRNDG